MKTNIEYHLKELEIALNQYDERKILPDILDSESTLLDIGCGIGQTYIALEPKDKICIGLDNDEEAIGYGMKNYGEKIHYLYANAEVIPLPSNSIDLVFSRVSLPYTNIPKVLKEINRILKKGGRVWMTLHEKKRVVNSIKELSFRPKSLLKLIHGCYVLINGYLLKYFGFLLPFVNGKYESWQDTSSIKFLLQKYNFKVFESKHGKHIVIEGVLSK